MYRIGIMEDGMESTEEMERWIREYAEKMQLVLEICRWRDEAEVVKALDGGCVPDLLFLSVGGEVEKKTAPVPKRSWRREDGRTREVQLKNFGKKDDHLEGITKAGIIFGKKLRGREDCLYMQIVYVSSNKELYEGLVQTRPMDILCEPVTREAVQSSVRNAIPLVKNMNERFSFQIGKMMHFLPMRDILYFCANGRNVCIFSTAGEFEFIGRMKEVTKRLPEEFLAIHRSYIINKNHVLKYHYESLVMKDGTLFTISKRNRPMVRQILMDR